MAYICEKETCEGCDSYRFDMDYGDWCCFYLLDTKGEVADEQ